MKFSNITLAIAAAALALAGCNRVGEGESNFDNKVYIKQAENNNTLSIALKPKDVTLSKTIQAALAKPQQTDVNVTYRADFSLLDHYAKSTGMEYTALSVDHYSFSATEALINSGNVRSNDIRIDFTDLNELPRGVNFLLPVTIENSNGVDVLEGSKTLYYVIRQGAMINTAVSMTENYFEVPTFATSPAAQGLTRITFEALIRPRKWKEISTIMGVEDYCLVRVGDTFPKNTVQLAYTGANLRGPDLVAGDWMHLACTYDLGTESFKWYINGEMVQASSMTFPYSTIDLGNNPKNDRNFYIGYSYLPDRYFDGDMCEVRIWNTVRTQQEIAENIYDVDPTTAGLVAYWKFDEGSGMTVIDHSANGNNAVAKNAVKWVKVELPAN